MTQIPQDDIDIYQKYGLKVKDTHMRSPVHELLPLSYMIDMTATEQMNMVKFYSEKIYALEITETCLNNLITDLKHFHEYIREPIAYREMIDRERNTRKRNPAVQKAWENYKLLLKLAAEGRTIDFD